VGARPAAKIVPFGCLERGKRGAGPADAQASIVCAKQDRFDYGSHTIFLGRVTSVDIHGEVDPLIYVDGRYAGLPPTSFLLPSGRRWRRSANSSASRAPFIDRRISWQGRDARHSRGEGSMIYVSKEVAANAPGHPTLTRGEIWKGLVMKADNALPFVPGMAKCDVIERTANGLVRDIVFRGEDARERITFYPEEKVVFLRLSEMPTASLSTRSSGTATICACDSASRSNWWMRRPTAPRSANSGR
jgi:hypothetical protein